MNPAFAIAEVIWIMAGRNDAGMLNFFNPKLPNYAGYGDTYHGAYGYRIRRAFGIDQLSRATEALAQNPDSRQVVLQIWDASRDLPDERGAPASPDVPCNLLSLLKVRNERLEWTQVLRSNDLVLGLPHNIVQFTSLQEVVAGWLGLRLGRYTHLSDSLHVYERDLGELDKAVRESPQANTDTIALPYQASVVAWRELERRTDELISRDLTPGRFERLLDAVELPIGFRNLLVILGADAARRRGWGEQMERASAACTNPALMQLWRAWLSRAGLSATA